jgi:hypothetical protein
MWMQTSKFQLTSSEFSLRSPLLPLVDNVWIKVKMQKCITKYISIYMSFSNKPNLVSKAKNETKITHMTHSIVKASPQVIYENTSMWQSKISRFKQFYQKKARFTCKSLSMSHLSHKHAYHSKIIQVYQILSKRSWQTPIKQSMSCQSSWAMCPLRGDISTGEHHATCFAPICER